jgi:formylglycine-generating enzyme required for sulfatase activity
MMKSLRELAREYAKNVIDRESYRNSRRELIQGISAGKIEVEVHEYLAPLEIFSEELDETNENLITQITRPKQNKTLTPTSERPEKPQTNVEPKPVPSPAEPSTGIFKRRNILIIVGAIIVLCILILTILLFSITEDKPSTTIDLPIVQSSAGQALIIDFIRQKNWTQENMDVFVASWQQMSAQEQTAAFSSPEMKRLINTIYQQLLDERALLSLGDVENAVANQHMLVNFAEQLGIEDKRLKVLEPNPVTYIEAETGQLSMVDTVDSGTEPAESGINTIAEIATEDESNFLSADTESQALQYQESAAESPQETQETMASDDHQIETTPEIAPEQHGSPEETPVQEIPVQETPVQEIQVKEINVEQPTTKTVAQKISNKAACKTSLVKSRKPYCRDIIEGVGNGPTMVVIKSGEFTMGGKNGDEQPAHTVTINSHFAMSVHEISFAEYDVFCQSKNTACPKQPWSGKNYPVVNITHSDATTYTEWLSKETGQSYRLPSEAEWEYAARAGTKSEYPFGDEILISHAVFSDKKKLSAPLPKSDRSINKNKFRLYHMVGNVREWVSDTWHDGYSGAPGDGSARIDTSVNQYIVRGGSYADPANALRSGAREKLSSADNYTGFRVLQELSE